MTKNNEDDDQENMYLEKNTSAFTSIIYKFIQIQQTMLI
jgi:hypothetical protein